MKDENFKKLIQNIDLDEPGDSFTNDIMKMVETEELRFNTRLLSAIKKELLAEPSSDFTVNIMADIQSAGTSDPIISKKVQLTILGLGISLLFFALFVSGSTLGDLQKNSYLPDLGLNLSRAVSGITEIATSILPYLIPLSVLSFLDYCFRGRRRQLS